MKKIILSIFIIGLSLLGFAQDRVIIDEDFDTFKPTGWTSVDNSTIKWSKSAYPKVVNSVSDQMGKLISPSIALTIATNYHINFNYYQEWTTAYTGSLTLVVSYNNGVTWDPASVNADLLWTMPSNTSMSWAADQSIQFTPAASGNAKFAFIVDGADGDFDVLAIDDFVLVDETVPSDYRSYHFENGYAAVGAVWTVDNTGSVATTTWADEFLAAVHQDTAAVPSSQQESFLSPKTPTPVVGYGSIDGTFTYYSLVNNGGSGVTVYVANQNNWASPSILDVTHINSSSTGGVTTISFDEGDINAACGYTDGDSLQFTFEFVSNAGDVDYYLENFMLEMLFDESSVQADANLTLTGDTVAVFPLNARYNGDFAESFWEVAPQGWTKTTVTGANWSRETNTGPNGEVYSPVSDHDYYAYIDTVGADKVAMNDTLTSVVIPITYPATTANYKLAFEWANETNRNAGLNIDPLLGPGADYDYADVIVQIKVNAGAYTTIWQEDNITLLNANTVTTGTDYYYGWTGYQDYLDNPGRWYKSILDISQYLTATTTSIQVRAIYTGSGVNGGAFALDNLYVTEAAMVEFEIEAMQSQSVAATYEIDYYNIPISQVVNPVALSAKILNNGVVTFPTAPLTATVTVDDGSGPVSTVYGYKSVTSAAWVTRPSTVLFTIDTKAVEFTSGLTLTAGNTYTYDYSTTLNGTPYSDDKTFMVGTDMYNKHDGDDDGDVNVSDGTSGAIGSVFEFKVNDVIDYVKYYVANYTSNSEVYMSIIKLTTATSTSGTTVYTSPRKLIESSEVWFDANVALTTGFYAIMLHQTDLNAIALDYNDLFEGQVLRGKASALYTASNEKFNLKMDVGIVPNVDPVIVTEFPNDKIVVSASTAATDSVLFEIIATDENGDAITFPTDSITTNPSWLASWMKYKTTKGDTLIIYGKPLSSDLGETEVRVVAKDTKNGSSSYTFTIEVVSDMAFSEPDFEADFRLFTQVDNILNTDNDQSWHRNQSSAFIYGDSGDDSNQKERLISAPIKMPTAALSVGISYTLEFDWQAGNGTSHSQYFIGGIPGVLGTEDADGGANYADISLVVSTNNGGTWSAPIWKEDDQILVANSTEGIYQGEKWGYDGGTTYTSKINVDAYKGKTVVFAFLYESKNVDHGYQNYFRVEDLTVTANEEVDVDVFIHTDLTSVPTQHLDWETGLTYTVQLINRGQKIPAGASLALSFPIQGKYTEYALNDASFAVSDTIYKSFTFVPDSGLINQDYTLTATLSISDNVGSAGDSKTISVADNVLNKDYDSSTEEYTLAQYDGLGTIYQLEVKDILETIQVGFNNSGTNFSISIIKLDSIDATEGKLIATINDDNGSDLYTDGYWTNINVEDDEDFEKPLMLEAGYYAVMVNQLEENNQIYIYRSDRDQDMVGFVRGDFNELYNEVDDQGFLTMALNFKTNEAPEFTTLSIEDEEVFQGETFERSILVSNPNTYGDIFIEGLAIPQWLVFVDNGDGTASLDGDASDAVPGKYLVSLRAHNRFMVTDETFEITVLPNPVPEFATAPPSVAYTNAVFSYKAIATDQLMETVSITGALLPSWLTVSAANDTVTLTGTPLAANIGNNVVKLTATDVYGNVSHQTFNVFVYANTAPEFISVPVTESAIGIEYSYYVVATDANGNSGLTISANAGLASWLTFTNLGSGKATLVGVPVAAGTDTVTLTVTDPAGVSAVQKFAVVRSTNTAPGFTSIAVTTATEDEVYRYEVAATDADGDMLYFNTEVIPNWLTFTVTGNGTAVLQGIPLQSSAGDTEVSLLVGDGNNTVLQNFTIVLALVNDAPAIISTAVETAIVGEVYSYAVEAYDEEGASLIYAAKLPSWLSISESNGIATISGIPTDENVGVAAIEIAVNDGNSSSEQAFNLSVAGAVGVSTNANIAVDLYPNPTSGSFNVRNAEGAKVYVINNNGQIVKQINKASKIQEINISEFNAGTYFVRIVTNDKVLTKSLNLIK